MILQKRFVEHDGAQGSPEGGCNEIAPLLQQPGMPEEARGRKKI